MQSKPHKQAHEIVAMPKLIEAFRNEQIKVCNKQIKVSRKHNDRNSQ